MKLLGTFIIVILLFISSFSFSRPTNDWLIIFDDNKQVFVEAQSVDEALEKFRRKYKRAAIYSASRYSYVQSVWIWKE